jgi:hypothetical protein
LQNFTIKFIAIKTNNRSYYVIAVKTFVPCMQQPKICNKFNRHWKYKYNCITCVGSKCYPIMTRYLAITNIITEWLSTKQDSIKYFKRKCDTSIRETSDNPNIDYSMTKRTFVHTFRRHIYWMIYKFITDKILSNFFVVDLGMIQKNSWLFNDDIC